MALFRLFLFRGGLLSLPAGSGPCVWAAVVAAASLMAAALNVWIALGIAVTGSLVGGWRSVKQQVRLHGALAVAEQERASMEAALRRAQKMEALGRLTVGVAHDFNNHLTVISSNVEMVIRRLAPEQERLLRHTAAAMQGVRRAALLTGRLLSLSRQPSAEPEMVDIDRLVEGLAELLRRTLGDRVRLEVKLSGSFWFTWVDVSQMENALLSLVVNARDQVPDGGILRIGVSNVQLDAVFVASHPTVVAGDYIQIAINGSPEATQWEPADDMTGADLFMARAFVREAGGCLLRGDTATGLSLRLFLPRHVPPSVGGLSRNCPAGSARILVVEDEAPIRAACVETLRGLGYDVLEAPDAMEAFRLIADLGGIDLLFTDLGLPGGVSGRALADAARNVDASMRVLFTTGYDRVDLPGQTAASLLRKPFSPGQLAAKVRDVLGAPALREQSETVQG